jgi:hypothetical protein
MPDFGDIKKFIEEHDEQVDKALDKVGDAAAAKFGHKDQIEKGVEWAQEHTGKGDTHRGDGPDHERA